MKRRYNVVELYAGTARSWEPFRRWRKCRLGLLVDSSKLARETYLHNFPAAPYVQADLKHVTPAQIQQWVGGSVDILLGCPPCQGFSEIGARAGADPRNRHVAIFSQFVAKLKPVAVAIENVPQFVASRRFRPFCEMLERSGYVWTAGILNAVLRGSVQCRQRFILVAVRRDTKSVPEIPQCTHGGAAKYYSYGSGKMMMIAEDPIGLLGRAPSTRRLELRLQFQEKKWGSLPIPTISDVLTDLPAGDDKARALSHVPWAHTGRMQRRMGRVPEGGRWSGGADHYSQSYGRLHRKGLARTITTFFSNPGSGRFWHPTENRALTLREAARIQGFPDSFRFIGFPSLAAVLVGNALDASFAEVVYRTIRACLD